MEFRGCESKLKERHLKVRLLNFTCKTAHITIGVHEVLVKISRVSTHSFFVISSSFLWFCFLCRFSFTVVAAVSPSSSQNGGLVWICGRRALTERLEFCPCFQATGEDWVERTPESNKKENSSPKKCIAEKFFCLWKLWCLFQRLRAPKLCLWCSAVINHRTNDAALLHRHARGNILLGFLEWV